MCAFSLLCLMEKASVEGSRKRKKRANRIPESSHTAWVLFYNSVSQALQATCANFSSLETYIAFLSLSGQPIVVTPQLPIPPELPLCLHLLTIIVYHLMGVNLFFCIKSLFICLIFILSSWVLINVPVDEALYKLNILPSLLFSKP